MSECKDTNAKQTPAGHSPEAIREREKMQADLETNELFKNLCKSASSMNVALKQARKSGIQFAIQVDGAPRYDLGVYGGPPYTEPDYVMAEWATRVHVLQRRQDED